ncbi:MAG: gamma-glutamyltransferase [Gammaproteobacteria bacterium]|nr:gamma-glutamyltransferase [Gammaproteobacteria bacterium]
MATAAGEQVLRSGGNAFDAAVAVAATLAVVEPYSSGLGGGGFFLLHRARDNFEVMIDARETAPLAATRDMYLDELGEVKENASINGALAAGIPGLPAALEHVSNYYGTLPFQENLQPAIRLAQQGFMVDEHYQKLAGFRLPVLRSSKDAAAIFLQNNEVPADRAMIRQPDLAITLQRMARDGSAGFYRGEIADKLVKSVRAHGGIWTLEDLKKYRVIERAPLRGDYHGMKITSAALPSSGGIALIEILNQLEAFDLQNMSREQRLHFIIEAMRRAYRDRAAYLGDSDFVSVPVQQLMDKDYAAGLRAGINADKATPSATLPEVVQIDEGHHTTHFSIVDKEGNRVAATLSINYPFGSGFVAQGTGVLLNDEMDDFSIKPGVPNVYGLVGNEANAIAPGKRMLSSMSPTLLETEDQIAVIGTPGGSRIITMVLFGMLNFYDHMDAKKIVNAPRIHHQYLPDKVFYEPGALDKIMIEGLTEKGHVLEAAKDTWGNMQLVIINKKNGMAAAASDRRGAGKAVVIP